MRKYVSLALKGGIFLCAMLGVIWAALSEGQTATTGIGAVLYFTQQSNLWMAFISLTLLICGVLELRTKVAASKRWMYVAKWAFTVSITLTGFIFCFVLAPASQGAFSPWRMPDFLTHVATPVLSVVDFFVDDYPVKFRKRQTLFCLLPPLYYFAFSIICGYEKVDFGGGSHYPYFFLNFNSPMGWFGVGGEFPYFFGTFYWVIGLMIVVFGTGCLYGWLHNKRVEKSSKIKNSRLSQ